MTAFTVNNTIFGWREISAAAAHWGEWAQFTERTRRLLACLNYAAATGQAPDEQDIRAAAAAFRYARKLISADDANAWFAARELTSSEWLQYLRGKWLVERWSARLNDILATQPINDEAVAAVSKKHAHCSGLYEQWAQKLAGRAAIAAAASSLAVSGQSPQTLVAHIEAEFAQQRQQAVTAHQVAAKIAAHQLDWIRFDCRYVWFPEERLAREAALCVKEDGLTLDEVANDARSLVQHWNFYLDELDAAARPRFLAARPGDWLGPVKLLEGFPLFSVAAKRLPAVDDPQIKQRAEEAVIASLIKQALNERVNFVH